MNTQRQIRPLGGVTTPETAPSVAVLSRALFQQYDEDSVEGDLVFVVTVLASRTDEGRCRQQVDLVRRVGGSSPEPRDRYDAPGNHWTSVETTTLDEGPPGWPYEPWNDMQVVRRRITPMAAMVLALAEIRLVERQWQTTTGSHFNLWRAVAEDAVHPEAVLNAWALGGGSFIDAFDATARDLHTMGFLVPVDPEHGGGYGVFPWELHGLGSWLLHELSPVVEADLARFTNARKAESC